MLINRVIPLAIAVALIIGCATAPATPQPGAIELGSGLAAVGMWAEIERTGRLCKIPAENLFVNPDGSMYALTEGTQVQILKRENCDIPKSGMTKIKVLETGFIGWTFSDSVIAK